MKRNVLMFTLFSILLAFSLVLPCLPTVDLFPANEVRASGYHDFILTPTTSVISKVYCGSIGFYEFNIKNTSTIKHLYRILSLEADIVSISPSYVQLEPNKTSAKIKIIYRMPVSTPLNTNVKLYFKIELNVFNTRYFYFQAQCIGNDNCFFSVIRDTTIPELCPGQSSTLTFKIKNTHNKSMYFKWEKGSGSSIKTISPTSIDSLAPGNTSGNITITYWMPVNIQTGQLATYAISIWAGCCKPPSCPPVTIFFKAKSKSCCCDYKYIPVTTGIPQVCAGKSNKFLFTIRNTCSMSTKYVISKPNGVPISSISPSTLTLAPGSTSAMITITYTMETSVNTGAIFVYHFTIQSSNNDPPNCPPETKTFSAKRKICPK
jgi:hypothetical protein